MQTQLQQNILKELGLENMAPEKKAIVMEKIGKVIFQAILIRVLEGMSESDKERFDEHLKNNPDDMEALFGYLEKNVLYFSDVVEQEILKFKKESLGILGPLNK
ncbi:MAG: hypothetical protein WCG01_02625 [bacterium]